MSDNIDLPHQADSYQQLPHSFKPIKPLTLIAAILLTALVAGTGGYLLGMRNNQSNPPSQPSLSPQPRTTSQGTQKSHLQPSATSFIPTTFYPVPSVNPELISAWKTYKSEKYSFTFLYPPRMVVNHLKPLPAYPWGEDIFFTTPVTYDDFWKNKTEQERQSMQPQEGIIGGDLLVNINDKDFFEDSQTLDTLKNRWTDYKDEGIVIGGKNGRIISGFDYVSSQKKPHIRNIDVPLQQGKHLEIQYYEEAITLDEFNRILSTFKFTN